MHARIVINHFEFVQITSNYTAHSLTANVLTTTRSRHRKQHDRPFECSLCKRRFSLKHNLNRHKLGSHTNSRKLIKCEWPLCVTQTTREDYLLKHMRKAHRKELSDPTEADAEIERFYQKSIHHARRSAGKYNLTLHEAVANGNLKEVRDLIAQGDDVNAEFPIDFPDWGRSEETPLSLSVLCGHENIFSMLVGLDPSPQSLRWAFFASIRTENCIVAQKLFDKGVKVDEIRVKGRHYTALDMTSSKNQTDMVKFLLSKGAAVEPCPRPGDIGSPLIHASRMGHTAVIRLLFDRGAKINRKDQIYGNALGAASSGGHLDAVRWLFEKGANIEPDLPEHGRSPLMNASLYGSEVVARYLLENGAQINREGGWSRKYFALGEAVESGHKSIVRLLLEKGANPQISLSSYWGSPLRWAIRPKKPEMEAILREFGVTE